MFVALFALIWACGYSALVFNRMLVRCGGGGGVYGMLYHDGGSVILARQTWNILWGTLYGPCKDIWVGSRLSFSVQPLLPPTFRACNASVMM